MADNYNSYNIIWISAIIIAIAILLSSNSIKVVYDSAVPLDDYGVETSIQDYNGRTFNMYVSEEKQLTELTDDVNKGQFYANVENATNCVVGNSIDLWNDETYFQGTITSVVGNRINFVSQITENYSSSNTIVKCGNLHLNVDGSTIKKTFYINPPTNKSWDIESIGISFIDTSDYDSSTFGNIPALTNGFTGGIQNGKFQRLFFITKNIDFLDHSFDYVPLDKAPSGKYGFHLELLFENKYGAIPVLKGSENYKMIFNVNDDLTSQEDMVLSVRGHYKDE